MRTVLYSHSEDERRVQRVHARVQQRTILEIEGRSARTSRREVREVRQYREPRDRPHRPTYQVNRRDAILFGVEREVSRRAATMSASLYRSSQRKDHSRAVRPPRGRIDRQKELPMRAVCAAEERVRTSTTTTEHASLAQSGQSFRLLLGRSKVRILGGARAVSSVWSELCAFNT